MAQEDLPSGIPASARWTLELGGIPTDVLFCAYDNINMLTITHTQTMGTIILVKCALVCSQTGSEFRHAWPDVLLSLCSSTRSL